MTIAESLAFLTDEEFIMRLRRVVAILDSEGREITAAVIHEAIRRLSR